MEALDFSLILSIINALIALILIPIIQFNEISTLSLLILYFKTIIGALAFLFVMLAIKNLEISGALPLMILTPAFFILGENLSALEIVGLGTLLMGIYILETSTTSSMLESLKVFRTSRYKRYLVGAILLFTISTLIDKFLLKNHQLAPISFLFFQQIFLAINFVIIYLLSKGKVSSLTKSVSIKMVLSVLLISLFTIGYRYTQLEAMKIAPVALVLSIKRTSIFFAAIIGGRIFSERALLRRGIATLFLLIGVYLIVNM